MSNPNLPISGKYNTYIGARYVPLMGGEWNQDKAYEPLVIVTHQGNSYTSNTFVPAGTDINDKTYWTLTGNYNGQVEQYRGEVEAVKQEVNQLNTALDGTNNDLTELQTKVNANEADIEEKVTDILGTISIITPQSFGSVSEDTLDIMCYTNGTNMDLDGLPVNDTPLNFYDRDTIYPNNRNIVIVIPPESWGITDWINTQRDHNWLHSNIFVMLGNPTSTTDFSKITRAHIDNLRTSSTIYRYIYNMYPYLCYWNNINPSDRKVWVKNVILKSIRFNPGNTTLTNSATINPSFGVPIDLIQYTTPFMCYCQLGIGNLNNNELNIGSSDHFYEKATINTNLYVGTSEHFGALIEITYNTNQKEIVPFEVWPESMNEVGIHIYTNHTPFKITRLLTREYMTFPIMKIESTRLTNGCDVVVL